MQSIIDRLLKQFYRFIRIFRGAVILGPHHCFQLFGICKSKLIKGPVKIVRGYIVSQVVRDIQRQHVCIRMHFTAVDPRENLPCRRAFSQDTGRLFHMFLNGILRDIGSCKHHTGEKEYQGSQIYYVGGQILNISSHFSLFFIAHIIQDIATALSTISKPSYNVPRDYQNCELQRIKTTIQPAEPFAVVAKFSVVKSKRENRQQRTY